MSQKILVADWDETITVSDTTLIIANVAYKHKPGLKPFRDFTRIYLDALAAYNSQFEEGACADFETEVTYQKGLKNVEMKSIAALVHYKIFQGLTPAQFAEDAGKIELKLGFLELVEKLDGDHFYILSVNWSRTLIEAVLKFHGVRNFTVLANDLQVDMHGITTGNFVAEDIRTGYDKLLELRKIRRKNEGAKLVYVGDSRGDVLPILESDIGIVIEGGRARNLVETEKLEKLKDGIYEASWAQISNAWY